MTILFSDTMLRVILAFLIIILLFALLHIKYNRKNEMTIVERLGKFKRLIEEPVFFFILPFVDRVLQRISKDEIVEGRRFICHEQDTDIKIDFTIRYTVFDPRLYAYASIDPIGSIVDLIKTAKENQFSDQELEDQIRSYGRDLGITVLSFHLINQY